MKLLLLYQEMLICGNPLAKSGPGWPSVRARDRKIRFGKAAGPMPTEKPEKAICSGKKRLDKKLEKTKGLLLTVARFLDRINSS